MPVVITSSGKDSTHDLIKRFKKATAAAGIVQQAKDKRFHIKKAKIRAEKKIQTNRLKRRVRSLKRMKNVPSSVITRLTERISA